MIKQFLAWPYALSSVLCGAAVALLVIMGVEIDWGQGISRRLAEKRMAPATPQEAKLLPVFALGPLAQSFPETADRPLFVPTRRPPPPLATGQGEIKPGQFILVGTSITKEFGDVAIVREIATNKTFSVRRGEQINGITIDKVDPDRIVLKLGNSIEEVAMKTQASPKGPPPGAVPPPQPGMAQMPRPGNPMPGTPGTVTPGVVRPATVVPGLPAGAPGVPRTTAGAQNQPTPEEILARRRAARGQIPQ